MIINNRNDNDCDNGAIFLFLLSSDTEVTESVVATFLAQGAHGVDAVGQVGDAGIFPCVGQETELLSL